MVVVKSYLPQPDAPRGEPTGTRGYSGRVTKIYPDGSKSTVADHLPSYAGTVMATGPSGLSFTVRQFGLLLAEQAA